MKIPKWEIVITKSGKKDFSICDDWHEIIERRNLYGTWDLVKVLSSTKLLLCDKKDIIFWAGGVEAFLSQGDALLLDKELGIYPLIWEEQIDQWSRLARFLTKHWKEQGYE